MERNVVEHGTWNLERASIPGLREEAMPRYLPVQPDAAYDEIKEVYSTVEGELGIVPNYLKNTGPQPSLSEARRCALP